jgi:cytoskeletal protein RodZ
MAEDTQVDFGTMFKQARERRGLTLQQLAAVTKISARVLGALEHNDVSKLPGGIFSRAFVRSYAREIGLDPEMAIDRFTQDFPDESGKEQLPSAKEALDIEAYESGRRVATTVLQVLGLSIVVIVVVLVFLNYGSWRKPATPAPAASVTEPAPAASPVPAPVPEQPRADAVVTEPAAPITTNTATPVSAPPAAASATTAPASPAPISLVIVAKYDCWLMVKVDKDVVFERVMRAGERSAYEARTAVVISAGNAGGLALTINGKPARALGATGQVVTATITPDTLAGFLQ